MSVSIAGLSGVVRRPLRCGRASAILRRNITGWLYEYFEGKTGARRELILCKAEQPADKSSHGLLQQSLPGR